MKRNKFSKALKQLKSTEVDERIKSLEEAAPTNSIGGVYALNQPGQRLGPYDPPKVFYPDIDGNWPTGIPGTPGETTYVRPAGHWDSGPGSVPAVEWDRQVDLSHSGTSTDGFINPTDGTVLVNLPPDSSDFILGPLVDGYNYNHGYDDFTNIGYIQKDTRQFVLLARIPGYWQSGVSGIDSRFNTSRQWDGTSLTSYNPSFTLAMAEWFRDQYNASTYVKNVSYYYSGGYFQSGNPDPNAPAGTRGGAVPGAGNGGDASSTGAGPYGSGTSNGEPNIGTPQNTPNQKGPEDAGFPWGPLSNFGNAIGDAIGDIFGAVGNFFEPLSALAHAGAAFAAFLLQQQGVVNYTEDSPYEAKLPPQDSQAISDALNDVMQNIPRERWENLNGSDLEKINNALNPSSGPTPSNPDRPKSERKNTDEYHNIVNNIGRSDAFRGQVKVDKNGNPYISGITDNYVFTNDADASVAGAPALINFFANSFGAQNKPDMQQSPYEYTAGDANADLAQFNKNRQKYPNDPSRWNDGAGAQRVFKLENMPIRVELPPPSNAKVDRKPFNLGTNFTGGPIPKSDNTSTSQPTPTSTPQPTPTSTPQPTPTSTPQPTPTSTQSNIKYTNDVKKFFDIGQPEINNTPTPQPTPTSTKSSVPRLYQNRSAAWMGGSIQHAATTMKNGENFLNREFRGTTVSVPRLMSLGKELARLNKTIGLGKGTPQQLQRLIDIRDNTAENIKAEIEGSKPNLKPITQVPKISGDRVELEKNIEASLKQLDIDNEELKGEKLRRNLAFAADLGLDILTAVTLLSPIPGDEAAVIAAQASKAGIKTGAKQVSKNAVQSSIKKNVFKNIADDAADDAARASADLLLNKARYGDDALKYVTRLDDAAASGNTDLVRKIIREIDDLDPLRGFNKPPVLKPPTKSSVGTNPGGAYPRNSSMRPGTGPRGTLRNSYEPSGEVLTESRKRILREIKQPYKLPEQPKQKYKMNFKGKFTAQNTPNVTASKQTDEEVKAKNAAGQTWRTKDKHWSRYESQERMNVIYDHVGHGNQYWEMIVNENQNKKGIRDRKIQEQLNIIAHEKAMLQEDPNYVSPFKQKIVEQETMQYDNDPLFKKVASRLKKEIDYPDKPSKAGYPDTPPPEMVNGFHPEYGQKADRYNKLDPQSAEAMPPTGNPEIDAKVQKAKRLKKILGKKG